MGNKQLIGFLLMLALFGMVGTTLLIKEVAASETIYIRPDGSVDPSTAPIQRLGDLYTFTGDINDSILIQRDNIVVDGNGYKLRGAGVGYGFDLWGRISVIVKNTYIMGFQTGIYLHDNCNFDKIIDNTIVDNQVAIAMEGLVGSSDITSNLMANNSGYAINLHDVGSIHITGNNILNNGGGIHSIFGTGDFSGNIIANNYGPAITFQALTMNLTGNTITGNNGGIGGWEGYDLFNSNVRGNIISNNGYGIDVQTPTYSDFDSNIITGNDLGVSFWGMTVYGNTVFNNDIANNGVGFQIDGQGGNVIYYNNFVNNTKQAYDPNVPYEVQVWDNGYPSGGNYWSDYNGTDDYSGPNQDEPGSDGIGDTPYTINAFDVWINKDRYPLMTQYGTTTHVLTISTTSGGTTNPQSGTYFYNAEEVATVTAIPQTDYLLDHWEIDNVNIGSNPTTSVTMDSNHALHAVFRAKPALAITATTGGTTEPPPGTHIYAPGTVVTVTALPQADYIFDHWELDSINIGSDNPTLITMDANHALHAVFRLTPDIAITSVTPYPTNVHRGEPVYINVTVENQYGSPETFDVVVYADKDKSTIGDEIIVGTQTGLRLAPGTTKTLMFTWDTSAISVGTYYVSAHATVTQDREPSNNLLTSKKKIVIRR